MASLAQKRLFLLDMDGTIYLDHTLFPGTLPFLRQVRERVKRQHQLFYEPVGDLGASPVFRKREFLKPT